jgi:hypothetical protein
MVVWIILPTSDGFFPGKVRHPPTKLIVQGNFAKVLVYGELWFCHLSLRLDVGSSCCVRATSCGIASVSLTGFLVE